MPDRQAQPAVRPPLRARRLRRRVRRRRGRAVAPAGSSRWRSPGSARSATAGASPPTAPRATVPGCCSRSSRASWPCSPRSRRPAGDRLAVPPTVQAAEADGAPDRRGGPRRGAAAGTVLADGPVRSDRPRPRSRRHPARLRPGRCRAAERAVRCPVRAPARPRSAADGGRGAGSRPKLAAFAVPSASCRIGRLQGPRRRRAPRRPVPGPGRRAAASATRSSTSATRRTPIPSGGSPSRSGRSPTTARSTRSGRTATRSRAGRRSARRPRFGRHIASSRPARCCLADGSDSLSLDEALELLVATGWSLEAALLALIPEAAALRPTGHPAGRGVRPPDGRLPRAVGRPGRARVRRRPAGRGAGRPERAPSARVRRHPRSARGGRVRGRRGPDRRGRDHPARAARAGRDAARRPAPRGDPRGRRGEDRDPPSFVAAGCPAIGVRRPADRRRRRRGSTPAVATTAPALRHARRPRRRARPARHPDDGPRGEGAALEHGRRHADPGPGADRPTGRRSPPPGVRPGHEPADRPGARAGGHGPPRRARPTAGAARRHPDRATDRPARPADRRRPRRARRAPRPAPGPPARRDLGRPQTARPVSPTRSTGSRPRRCSPSRPARSSSSSISDRAMSLDRPPVPSVLAVGAVHTALSAAGLRGRADLLVDAADVLDVHGLAMAIAAGATAVHPRLAIELAAELAGSRGAEDADRTEAVRRLLDAFEAGLRKTLARMGISAVASYVGGALFETLELAPEVVERCFPAAAAWPGRIGFEDARRARPAPARGRTGARGGRRRRQAGRPGSGPLPGRRRAPSLRSGRRQGDPGRRRRLVGRPARRRRPAVAAAAVVRDGLRIRRPRGIRPVPLDEVEPARSIARRFVASAMSVGALSPEAHQAVTIGMQRAGGAANTGEGGEDPAWYRPTARTASVATPGSSRSPRPASGSPRPTSPGRTSSRSRSPRARSPARAASCRPRRRPPRSRRSAGPSRASR